MKRLGTIIGLLLIQACTSTQPEKESKQETPEINNAATRYVENLQMDVRKAEVNVNRMNHSIEKTEAAVNQALGQTE